MPLTNCNDCPYMDNGNFTCPMACDTKAELDLLVRYFFQQETKREIK